MAPVLGQSNEKGSSTQPWTKNALPQKSGWCVILGSYPYASLDKALAAVEKARQLGIEQAGVYDTRDFLELAWGELVVIAQIAANQEDAKRVELSMKKANTRAFVKACSPEKEVVSPILKKEDIRSVATLPVESLRMTKEDMSKGLSGGCFGWSSKKEAAICVLGYVSLQRGGKYAVRLLGLEDSHGPDAIPLVDSERLTSLERTTPISMSSWGTTGTCAPRPSIRATRSGNRHWQKHGGTTSGTCLLKPDLSAPE